MKTGTEKMLRIFTIGHSNLSFEEFASLLKEFGICLIADIFESALISFLKIVISRYLFSLQILALEEFDTSEVPI